MHLFAGDPQPVEIHHRGIWFTGVLLGWTLVPDGRVLARVRCVVDGLRRSTWKDLAELRLPDPAHPPRREAFPAPAPPLPRAADGREDDATRPHALLGGMRVRPQKPEHACTPPAARGPVLRTPQATPAAMRTGPARRRSDELAPV